MKVCPHLKYVKINGVFLTKKERIQVNVQKGKCTIWKRLNLLAEDVFSDEKKFNLEGLDGFSC